LRKTNSSTAAIPPIGLELVIRSAEPNLAVVGSTHKLMKKHHLHETCCARALVDLAVMVDVSKNMALHHQEVAQQGYSEQD
jgi:hypothetical protein